MKCFLECLLGTGGGQGLWVLEERFALVFPSKCWKMGWKIVGWMFHLLCGCSHLIEDNHTWWPGGRPFLSEHDAFKDLFHFQGHIQK